MTTTVPAYTFGGITRPALILDDTGHIILFGAAADFAATYGLKALYAGLPPGTPYPPITNSLSTPTDSNGGANSVAEGAPAGTDGRHHRFGNQSDRQHHLFAGRRHLAWRLHHQRHHRRRHRRRSHQDRFREFAGPRLHRHRSGLRRHRQLDPELQHRRHRCRAIGADRHQCRRQHRHRGRARPAPPSASPRIRPTSMAAQ